MNYEKVFSKISNRRCMCCGEVKKDMDVFIFIIKVKVKKSPLKYPPYYTTYSSGKTYTIPTTSITSTSPISTSSSSILPYETYEDEEMHVFLCAECLFKLSKEISPESMVNMVSDKL